MTDMTIELAEAVADPSRAEANGRPRAELPSIYDDPAFVAAVDALDGVSSDVLFHQVAKRWARDDRVFVEALVALHNAHREASSVTSRWLRKLQRAPQTAEAD